MPLEFEQQEKESDKAFAAFAMYLSMGSERSLEAVRQKCGKSSRLIQRWSSRWRWTERVTAHTSHLATVEREATEALARGKSAQWLKRQEEHRDEEWALRGELIAAGRKVLKRFSNLSGWQKRAWFDGEWDIAAGQFFTTFRREVHVVDDFDDTRAREWFVAFDYGFTHYTVALLGCTDGDGNVFVVDEHAERLWLPRPHEPAQG